MADHQLAQAYIQHNVELEIAICIQHKYTLSPEIHQDGWSSITHHFQESHKSHVISRDALAAISEYIPMLEIVEPSQVKAWQAENGTYHRLVLYKEGDVCM